jgi:hypothetical protein
MQIPCTTWKVQGMDSNIADTTCYSPCVTDFGEETLRSVLSTMYCEFLEKGDFEMVRVLVEALNASNPGLNLGEEAIEGIEGALKRLRSMLLCESSFLSMRQTLLLLRDCITRLELMQCLGMVRAAGAKHFRIVKFELIRLYEIQHDLRQLSYFDVFGRLRLSLQLARVTLSIPMAIDKAMREDDDDDDDDGIEGRRRNAGRPAGYVEDDEEALNASQRQVVKKGLLGPRIAGVLGLVSGPLDTPKTAACSLLSYTCTDVLKFLVCTGGSYT